MYMHTHTHTHTHIQGMEGTMYALIMSINNLGGIIGSQTGAALTVYLGVTEKAMENFWLLVFICNVSTCLPLALISWIPKEDPNVDHLGQSDAAHVAAHGGYSSIDTLSKSNTKDKSVV